MIIDIEYDCAQPPDDDYLLESYEPEWEPITLNTDHIVSAEPGSLVPSTTIVTCAGGMVMRLHIPHASFRQAWKKDTWPV